MIQEAVALPVEFYMLTWEGNEEELKSFIGDRFLYMEDDGTAVCRQPRGHQIRLRAGDHVLKAREKELPLLWFIGEEPWVGTLFAARVPEEGKQ